jgi:hypothetical protein
MHGPLPVAISKLHELGPWYMYVLNENKGKRNDLYCFPSLA